MLHMDNSVGNPMMLLASEEEMEQKVDAVIQTIETYDGRASADIVYDLLDSYEVETSDLPQWLWNRLAVYL